MVSLGVGAQQAALKWALVPSAQPTACPKQRLPSWQRRGSGTADSGASHCCWPLYGGESGCPTSHAHALSVCPSPCLPARLA
jgi:hypothetical protein